MPKGVVASSGGHFCFPELIIHNLDYMKPEQSHSNTPKTISLIAIALIAATSIFVGAGCASNSPESKVEQLKEKKAEKNGIVWL